MPDGSIDGFKRQRLPGDGLEIDCLTGGSGPPLLLLHGWPQTRVCWSIVAPLLAKEFTVVVPDLRGYGRSDKPADVGDHSTYSKRAMARDQIATMAALGFQEFAVAGHDRGGRVAYRLALDHPKAVTRLAVLDIIPTSEMWTLMDAQRAVRVWHWTWLAQGDGLPERMIGAAPDFFLAYIFEHQAAPGFAFDPANYADYLANIHDPAAVRGMCEDYRAGWTIDRELDERDRDHKRIVAPTLSLWGDRGSVANLDPLSNWKQWAVDAKGVEIESGHFMPEEGGVDVAAALAAFMSA